MSTDEASCSDCKMEIIERKWRTLLLNWIVKCGGTKIKYSELDVSAMREVLNNYKDDICVDELDKILLGKDDLEPFIRYKYPLLRLRYLCEDKDLPRKLYVMGSIVLFHAVANSQVGAVDSDICRWMMPRDQEWLLKFCENLGEVEITVCNVEGAIRESYEFVTSVLKQTSSLTVSKPEVTPKSTPNPNPESQTVTETGASPKNTAVLKFKSSVTVMPTVMSDTSSYSDTSDYGFMVKAADVVDLHDVVEDVAIYSVKNIQPTEQMVEPAMLDMDSSEMRKVCQTGCACSRCSATGPCCGDPGGSMDKCKNEKQKEDSFLPEKVEKWIKYFLSYIPYIGNGIRSRSVRFSRIPLKWKKYIRLIILIAIFILTIAVLTMIGLSFKKSKAKTSNYLSAKRFVDEAKILSPASAWSCESNFCQKVHKPTASTIYFTSLSRCVLLCMGPQLWPYPIGYTHFSKKLVALATSKLEYKFQSVPSEIVHQHLAEAFKLFIGDLVRLERIDMESNHSSDLTVKKMYIQIEVESDADPRLRLNTEESYTINLETFTNQVTIRIVSASFCGVRHGLETLSQMILLDQVTGNLITLSNVLIKDAPSYKYRGLMIDTATNYIPVSDLLRTIDAMATCKLNTFHWRITGVTSFPWYLPEYPLLFEYGAYDRALMYTSEHIEVIVRRASIRGIRVLIEVAAPGPVGRAWSWSPDVTCAKKNDNFTCDNILCLRLKMHDFIFDILQAIYTRIIDLTKVDDVFHLSSGLFSLSNCYMLLEDREGFLDKALERLRLANRGFLPKLPIIWYSSLLSRDLEAKTWDRLGVQMSDWLPNRDHQFLSRFKVVHSSKWDLSCQIQKQRCIKYRTWQEMYAWKSWRNIEVFTIEGGEATLWTDLVDSGNLDYHLWPRMAAVAERLWSDISANASANGYTYARLDAHRWRMVIRGVRVQPIWPVYCSFNPKTCISKIK